MEMSHLKDKRVKQKRGGQRCEIVQSFTNLHQHTELRVGVYIHRMCCFQSVRKRMRTVGTGSLMWSRSLQEVLAVNMSLSLSLCVLEEKTCGSILSVSVVDCPDLVLSAKPEEPVAISCSCCSC